MTAQLRFVTHSTSPRVNLGWWTQGYGFTTAIAFAPAPFHWRRVAIQSFATGRQTRHYWFADAGEIMPTVRAGQLTVNTPCR
jgi:hypothetical protein